MTRLIPNLLVMALVGCDSPDEDSASSGAGLQSCVSEGAEVGAEALPDWTLEDRNSTSPTHGESVSPRCTLDRIGLYYMLDAT